jgi:CRP/FNR family cyclic AMP-dependent transcriptional regulator|uniref:Cyclic nucleotide-binding domain-containing protein n=1 Tax=candidate division WOR-3 bacterium TaxID=2052148 RepID=A0A7C4YAD3_UNCW3
MSILDKVILFSSLSKEEKEKILSIAEERRFKPEEKIFNEGDEGDGFYIIKSGKVRISIFLPDVGEELLSLLREGNHFGEMAIIEDKPRSASAIADTETVCLYFNKEKFISLMKEDTIMENKILWEFIKEFSFRLRKTDKKLKEILLLIKTL